MRNLTLGALIVFGGILAALPFRKAEMPHGPGDADPMLATGPSADLAVTNELVPYDQLFVPPESVRNDNVGYHTSSPPASLASAMRSPDRLRGLHSDAVASPRRDLRLPLTYDDLAVPLANPDYADGRFDALASVQAGVQANVWANARANLPQPGTPPHTATGIEAADSSHLRPSFEPLRVSVGEQRIADPPPAPWAIPRNLPESILESRPPDRALPQSASGSVTGRLASDPQRNVTPATTAEPTDPATRPRHWIRQPD